MHLTHPTYLHRLKPGLCCQVEKDCLCECCMHTLCHAGGWIQQHLYVPLTPSQETRLDLRPTQRPGAFGRYGCSRGRR